jgi:hypothetical protein
LRNKNVKFRILIVLALAVSALSCSEPPPPPPPPDTSVENVELAVKLAAVPAGLEVSVNEGRNLELRPTGEDVDGVISFVVGPEQRAINLVAAVHDHQAKIEAQPDGEYMGARELSGDAGVVFYSRGRFLDGEAAVEETVLFLIHPRDYRLLEIQYRYPAADDSAARVEQLIEVLSELE